MPGLRVRWTESEARRPYGRPFAVTFHDDAGETVGRISLGGADLLYYRQFQAAVLTQGGELFRDRAIDGGDDPQRAWLDRLAELMPPARSLTLRPATRFHEDRGRIFHLEAHEAGELIGLIEAPLVLDYQEFQAALAHQTGRLFRSLDVETVEMPSRRQARWLDVIAAMAERPGEEDAMGAHWPWRERVSR